MLVQDKKSIKTLIRLLELKNYVLYSRPYELNIIGVRHNGTVPNKFDDKLYVFWKNDKGIWEGDQFNITTDPGTFWLENPMSPKGTAILKEGQYIGGWKLGLHQGKYKALTQAKPITVYRNYDRKALIDFNNGTEETGLFGVNIHRANAQGTTKVIDKYSAGCQVFENAEDFAKFLVMTDKHEALYGNSFTYTLVDERAYIRALKRKTSYVLIAGIVIASAWIGYRFYKGLPIIPKI